MATMLQTVSLTLFTAILPGALGDLPRSLAAANLSFERVLVLTGGGPTVELGRTLAESLESAGMAVRAEEIGAATFEEVDRVKSELVEGFFPQLLVAVGGGSVIDVEPISRY